MERLMHRGPDGTVVPVVNCRVSKMSEIYDRLAAYEDTGLEPEEIVQTMNVVKSAVSTFEDFGVDRLCELVQADREGISPCTFCRFNPPSSSDGKPCCMCPAQAALRREQE